MATVAKTCTKCGVTRVIGQFYRNRRAATGRHTWCKWCMAASSKQILNHTPINGEEEKRVKSEVDASLDNEEIERRLITRSPYAPARREEFCGEEA